MIDLHGYGWQMLLGLGMTIQAALASIALAILIGLIAAAAKLSRSRVVRKIAEIYTITIRGIPDYDLLSWFFSAHPMCCSSSPSSLGRTSTSRCRPSLRASSDGFVYGAFTTEVFRGASSPCPRDRSRRPRRSACDPSSSGAAS